MKNLISNINAGILALPDVLKVKAKAMALAESVAVRKAGSDAALSAIVEDNGKATPTLIDNMKEDLLIYHKLNGKSYTTSAQQAYGNTRRVEESCDLSLIICGKRTKLNQYDLESEAVNAILAAGAMPTQTSFVKQTIWQAEFGGYNMPLPLDLFLIKINYRAASRSVCR